MKLYSAQQCQQLDQQAVENHQVPSFLLMKKAAFCAFNQIKQSWPNAQKIGIVCGTGNNGGDGFMLAQYATLSGMETTLLVPESVNTFEQNLKDDALLAYQEAKQLEIPIQTFDVHWLENADLVVDALFGTGLDREVTGIYAEMIHIINSCSRPIIALDTPSGLNATTGRILGTAIQADCTLTFIAHKPGLWMYQGADFAGKISLCDLNFKTEWFQNVEPIATSNGIVFWQKQLPLRQKTFHKGSTGTALLIGGNTSMMGAIQLAGQACLKTGAGLTKILSQTDHILPLTTSTPEFMCYDLDSIENLLDNTQAIAIGPGLGIDSWAKSLFQRCLTWQLETQGKMVIDADALKLLAQQKIAVPKSPNWILTPHPGEAATMLGRSVKEVQNDRFEAIRALQKQYGGVIVLKGNGTLIYDGTHMELCPLGNPGMAVGGMGDVLTGILSSLLAQGLLPFEAACLGVYQHAAAADQYVDVYDEISLTPSDVIHFL